MPDIYTWPNADYSKLNHPDNPETLGVSDEWMLDADFSEVEQRLAAFYEAPQPDADFTARLSSQLGIGDLPNRSRSNGRHSGLSRTPPSSSTGRPPVTWVPGLPSLSQAFSRVSFVLVFVLLTGCFWIIVQNSKDPVAGGTISVSSKITTPLSLYTNGFAHVGMFRVSMQPGALINNLGNGPVLMLVEKGTVTFISYLDGEKRSLSESQTISATEGTTIGLKNTSFSPAVVLIAGIYSHSGCYNAVPCCPQSFDVEQLAQGSVKTDLFLSGTFSLQTTVVEEGKSAPGWSTGGPTWLEVDSGDLGLTVDGSYMPRSMKPGIETAFSQGTLIALREGTKIAGRNAGSGPLKLVILSIVKTQPAASSPP